MKNLFLLRFALLALLATSCAKTTDPTPTAAAKTADPFLGHWVAGEAHVVTYASTGQISHDNLEAGTYTADIDATNLTTTKVARIGGATETRTYAYTRTGETLTLRPSSSQMEYAARAVSSTSWTLESVDRYATGSTRVTIVYHR